MLIEPSQKALKSRLRKELRRRRAAVADTQRSMWDDRINQHLELHAGRTASRAVAAYMAFDGEPDLGPALRRLLGKGVTVALPVVVDLPGKPVITFRQWDKTTEMVANRFGIPEPDGTRDIRITDIDLVLVPLVGWDNEGGRLGMGASFYDRLFQAYAGMARPLRVGVGYELQRLDRVPREPWDVRLHGMVTEAGWHHFEE